MNATRLRIVVLSLILACFVWAYIPTFAGLFDRWQRDQQYSHGYFVPVFALLLLWLRRDKLRQLPLKPAWGGLLLVACGIALRLYGAYFYYEWYEDLSIIPCLAGICVVAVGWSSLRWAWPALAFLVFMFPLPFRLEKALAQPLQQWTTIASTYVLQTIGVPAFSEGNIIILSEAKIGVVEACSGLSMLLVFFALSFAVALFIQKPLWEKLLILISAIPIAIVSNVVRITVTGLLHELLGSETADAFFHGPAGWLMIPFALILLWLELKLLDVILKPRQDDKPVSLPIPLKAKTGVASGQGRDSQQSVGSVQTSTTEDGVLQ